ncbi:MAG: Gfo/Idh/MocA family oxidoreductase [Candidatus Latescibacteria bacterium]|nr:Gfo/Idh/MocA family oxidoreductase [Candidatus Latescibacterota bacterium]
MKTVKVTLNGTGFAADYTARVYGMIPHKNGVQIELAGVCSGHFENARKFAERRGVTRAYERHTEMVAAVRPDIDNVACANFAHGQYVAEAAGAGVGVIVLEKPPVIWPGYAEGRQADAGTRKREAMAYLSTVLDAVRKSGAKLLYAENFIYLDGMKGVVELLREAMKVGKGRVLYQWGVCAHQGSHAPAYDTPSKSGGGALFNKACHPLGSVLYLKQVEGILRDGRPIRPLRVSAVAMQVLKHQPKEAGEHFRVLQNVDDFGRITVVFEDQTLAEVVGSDLNISGIWNELAVTTDFAQYTLRVNPNDASQLFLPSEAAAGNILLREKLPTAQGTSFPAPNQSYLHGYVNEMNDAVECALQADRHPQSGALMAWDSMAVLMAAYESSEKGAAFIDVSEYTRDRAFEEREGPDPHQVEAVFLRK